MTGISAEEASQLADLLNQICSATIEALQEGNRQQQLSVAASLRDFHSRFGEESEVAPFVMLLIDWLEGRRPDRAAMRQLGMPFRRALQTMLDQVPESEERESPEGREPISRRVLSQLIAAVVAAAKADEVEVKRQLATQLLNIRGKLEPAWQQRMGPLLENLRSVLAGADPTTLPPVPEPTYQRLWSSAVQLLAVTELDEEAAQEQLLERLAHNTTFVSKANNPELTEAFLRSLMEIQRQALESEQPGIATLVGAIRAHLQGLDPSPLVGLLEGEELETWQKIMEQS